MTGSFCTVLAGCALAMLFGASNAKAASGRIMFSGAVVEPTCSVSDARIDATASPQSNHGSAPRRFACGSTDTAADAGRAYALTEVSLDAVVTAHDRLLDYFAGYLNAAGISGAEAKLVTQTFE